MRYLLVMAGIALLLSCESVDKLTQFTMDYHSSVTIHSSVGVDIPVQLKTPEIESNAESHFASNDTRKDLVEEILLQQSTLTITEPEDGDFSFLKKIELHIDADGLDEQLIASKDSIPENVGAKLELEIHEVNLKNYVQQDEFILKIKTVTDKIITEDHAVDIYSVFWVDAKILGQ